MEASMNKTITIFLAFALVGSLIGVGYVYNQNKETKSLLSVKETELIQKTDKLNQTEDKLTQTEEVLLKSQTDLQDLQKDLTIKQLAFDKLQKDFNGLNGEIDSLRMVNCSKTIKASEIQSVNTNLGLVDIITRIVESNYRFSSIQTTFDTVWNNSKTAIFEILNPDKESIKVVVSWDSKKSRVIGIYDFYFACFYFNN